ncbi:MAG: BrnT family toxin [Deltaproteobacteria bacterium]|nr:BrnT family toxin [Deltaproteobacteria bacterium]
MAQFQFILWLAYWYLQTATFEFQWDKGNSTKSIAKHGVSIEEVESIFSLKLAVPIGRQISPTVSEERLCVVGPSQGGRILSVVFSLREGRVRPISSRIASRKERSLYEKVRKTIEEL